MYGCLARFAVQQGETDQPRATDGDVCHVVRPRRGAAVKINSDEALCDKDVRGKSFSIQASMATNAWRGLCGPHGNLDREANAPPPLQCMEYKSRISPRNPRFNPNTLRQPNVSVSTPPMIGEIIGPSVPNMVR